MPNLKSTGFKFSPYKRLIKRPTKKQEVNPRTHHSSRQERRLRWSTRHFLTVVWSRLVSLTSTWFTKRWMMTFNSRNSRVRTRQWLWKEPLVNSISPPTKNSASSKIRIACPTNSKRSGIRWSLTTRITHVCWWSKKRSIKWRLEYKMSSD